MNTLKLKRISLFATISILFVMLSHCKKKEEAEPKINVTIATLNIGEGDTLKISNNTTNARTYSWTVTGGSYTSGEKEPNVIFTNEGTYALNLTASNGDGKTASASFTINVAIDTTYRLCNNKSKTWIVKSIKYVGSEMLTDSCQKDNEFVIVKSVIKDSFIMSEGKITCPNGTNLVDLPVSNAWRLNSKTNTFDIALSVLSNPINLNFVMTKLTHDEMEGFDAVNSASISLVRKP